MCALHTGVSGNQQWDGRAESARSQKLQEKLEEKLRKMLRTMMRPARRWKFWQRLTGAREEVAETQQPTTSRIVEEEDKFEAAESDAEKMDRIRARGLVPALILW